MVSDPGQVRGPAHASAANTSGQSVTMVDKYGSFSELARSMTEGRDFLRRRRKRGGATAVIAPHGGGIEPGTSEVAEAVAADDFSFYAFEGIKAKNGDLHITSTHFDEPRCVALVRVSPRAISIHGHKHERQVVFLGGRDEPTLSRLRKSLLARGFHYETHVSVKGLNQRNICNRTASGVGVQLELSKGLRRSFFKSLSKSGRRSKTRRFHQFVAAVREAIDEGTIGHD
jgi:phage replication-related protein YjqB (UPF0714/DUF867 family)